MSSQQEYLLNRLKFLKELHTMDGISRAEIMILLTAILSTCASITFPKATDRKRFVELLVSKSPDDFHINWVSVPALINAGLVEEQNTKHGLSSGIFTDEEIDMPLEDAKEKWEISLKELKRYCYANLIYDERCAYAHEYNHPKNTTPIPPTNRKNRLSYIGRSFGSSKTRVRTFDLNFLHQVVEFHIKHLKEEPKPNTWWLNLP